MHLPGFTGEASLGKSKRTYHGKYRFGGLSLSQAGQPASVVPSQLEGMEDLDYGEAAELMEDLGEEDMEVDEGEENGDED